VSLPNTPDSDFSACLRALTVDVTCGQEQYMLSRCRPGETQIDFLKEMIDNALVEDGFVPSEWDE
jgi:hypothetical protein